MASRAPNVPSLLDGRSKRQRPARETSSEQQDPSQEPTSPPAQPHAAPCKAAKQLLSSSTAADAPRPARAEPEAARQKRLEKNRCSARSHRAKIKSETETLTQQNAVLALTNDELERTVRERDATIEQLRAQVAALAPSLPAGAASDAPPRQRASSVQAGGAGASAAAPTATAPADNMTRVLSGSSASTSQPAPLGCLLAGAGACSQLQSALLRLGLPADAPRIAAPPLFQCGAAVHGI
jgi:bZIP transcription factor